MRLPSISWVAMASVALLWIAPGLGEVHADQVRLEVGVSNPTMLAGVKETNFVRIALTGFELPAAEDRPPVNVAVVIDTSGSMSGTKIQQAKEAAKTAIKRLQDHDIVSVVLYNSSVQVLVPATKATDRDSIIQKINSITADGSTALFAGVSKGAAEVRKFIDSDSVNRVILLSDGKANVGPRSPRELERLGASLVKEGISVSTMGLGLNYNEDLMTNLATAGNGNHTFIEEADDLVAVFNSEFNDLMSVVAGEFKIEATLADGVRPVRVLGTKADISGQRVHIPLTQLYSRQERYFVMEVEVDAKAAETKMTLVDVSVQYKNMVTETVDKLTSRIGVKFSESAEKVSSERDLETFAYCAVQIANERNVRATALRDAGQIEAATKLLQLNKVELYRCVTDCEGTDAAKLIPELNRNIDLNGAQAVLVQELDPSVWNRSRKVMRAEQNYNRSQQTYRVPENR